MPLSIIAETFSDVCIHLAVFSCLVERSSSLNQIYFFILLVVGQHRANYKVTKKCIDAIIQA